MAIRPKLANNHHKKCKTGSKKSAKRVVICPKMANSQHKYSSRAGKNPILGVGICPKTAFSHHKRPTRLTFYPLTAVDAPTFIFMLHQPSPINQRTAVPKTGRRGSRKPHTSKKDTYCNVALYKHPIHPIQAPRTNTQKGPTLHNAERVLPYYMLISHSNGALSICPQQYWSKNAIMVFSTSSRESLSLWIS